MKIKELKSSHPGRYLGPGTRLPSGTGGKGLTETHGGLRFIRGLGGDSRGSILLETVVASMVFAMVGVAVLSGLDMVYAYGARVEVQATAENLVRNQFEDAFGHEYLPPQTPYPTSIGVPAGYTVSIAATDMPTPSPNIERLTVSVSHDGATVMSVETIRFNKP